MANGKWYRVPSVDLLGLPGSYQVPRLFEHYAQLFNGSRRSPQRRSAKSLAAVFAAMAEVLRCEPDEDNQFAVREAQLVLCDYLPDEGSAIKKAIRRKRDATAIAARAFGRFPGQLELRVGQWWDGYVLIDMIMAEAEHPSADDVRRAVRRFRREMRDYVDALEAYNAMFEEPPRAAGQLH